MPLRYAYIRELNQYEKLLQDMGYPYVNTITRLPYEVLEPHAHHSSNMHYIVKGEMTIWNSKDGTEFGTFGAGSKIPVTAHTCYRAEMGAEGCIFVEGHQDLSPTSAKRYEQFGTMIETTTGTMEDNGKEAVNCSLGRCHWSYDGWYHMCAEYGDENSPNQVCDVKAHALSGHTPR